MQVMSRIQHLSSSSTEDMRDQVSFPPDLEKYFD